MELGRRLAAFEGDFFPRASASASDATWTSAARDSRRAAQAIAADMLSPQAINDWLARYATTNITKNILIITAGNIPFVGVHDLLCVLAAGHRALVQPSRRDADRMAWVVEQLLDIEPTLPVCFAADSPYAAAPDAVIAMGGEDATRSFRERFAGLPTLLRGHRSSLAVLRGDETPDELAALADDILAYSGLGCRNVSLVFVPRGYDFSALQSALGQYDTSPLHRNSYRQARALLLMSGVPFLDCGVCLLRECGDFSADVSVLNYAFYDTLSEVTLWVEEHDNEIQCLALSRREVDSLALPHPRSVALGRTQHPSLLDYPDGRDTMKFLLSL